MSDVQIGIARNEVIGTTRLRWGREGQLDHEIRETFDVSAFTDITGEDDMVVASRLVVRPRRRRSASIGRAAASLSHRRSRRSRQPLDVSTNTIHQPGESTMSDNVQWTSPLDLNWIPNGKLVTFTAMHQAAYLQYFQVTDTSGNPITFTRLDGGQATFPISGSGTDVGFLANGCGHFTKSDGMQIQFGSGGPTVPLVAAATPNRFFIDGSLRGGGAMYVTEDGTDMDYNDTTVVLQWYTSVG
jgi:hypothetical protein